MLIFKIQEREFVNHLLLSLPRIQLDEGGQYSVNAAQSLPFIIENELQELITRAILAVECENSLWIAEKMPDHNAQLTPQRRLSGRLGLKKSAVLPTIIVKEEDRIPLKGWQEANNTPIHIWHVFFDKAYGLAFDEAERLIHEGLIAPTEQPFFAPGGATTKKIIYKFYYHYAYPLGVSVEPPQLVADSITDKNGHILPYVRFEGGSLDLMPDALNVLNTL